MDPNGPKTPLPDAASNLSSTEGTRKKAPQALAGGRYELAEFVSKGGMGAVYRARDVELDRWVAVKCLLDISKEGSRALAVKEARTLASLSHPNIMRVFDILQSGDQVWIVSEWLEGRSLAQMPLPMPAPAVAAIMAQIYDALASAHSAQVIHRDIKPSNIMVGSDGLVSLIDFGVAFAPGASSGETLAGSLRYTDPRILEGEPPDDASDLFSAALLQVELMTGETVLPEMAPLPLYRHIKKSLRNRLDTLLDGSYPPLAQLVLAFINRAQRSEQDEKVAKEAAASAQALVRKFTTLSPQQYLAATLCEGLVTDPEAERTIEHEIEEALRDPSLSPRQKAPWLAFREQKGAAARNPVPPTLHRPSYLISRRTARQDMHLHGRRLAWTVGMTILIGIVGVVAGKHRFGSPSPEPPVPAVAVEVLPLPAREGSGSLDATDNHEITTKSLPLSTSGTVIVASPPPSANSLQPESPASVGVQIVANAWATVIIDGKEAGRLPQAAPFAFAPGPHHLRLENPSTEPLAAELTVQPGKPQKLHFLLQPKVAARTFKLSGPGHLIIDGVDKGTATQKNLNLTVTLSFGTHEVAIKRGSKIVKHESVALGPDSPGSIVLE